MGLLKDLLWVARKAKNNGPPGRKKFVVREIRTRRQVVKVGQNVCCCKEIITWKAWPWDSFNGSFPKKRRRFEKERRKKRQRFAGCAKAGMWNLFANTAHMNCGMSLAGRNLIDFVLKLYLYLPKERKEKKTLSRNERDRSWLTVYMFACHGVSFWHDVVFQLG